MFDQTQSNILDGLLIGDGYIPARQKLFYFGQCRKHREYVEYVARLLRVPGSNGFETGSANRTSEPENGISCSELRTLSHPFYAELRRALVSGWEERWCLGISGFRGSLCCTGFCAMVLVPSIAAAGR